MHYSITKGLDIPLAGKPVQTISPAQTVHSVALLGNDYHDMKPTMLVEEGQSVKLGQALFTDKKNPQIIFTSPGSGTVRTIQRGSKRRFQAIIIDLSGDDEVEFKHYPADSFHQMDPDEVKENLLKSGLWTALKTRPYSKCPTPDSSPHAIFVTAIDTNPLAADPQCVISENKQAYLDGLTLLSRLTSGQVHICQSMTAAEVETDNPQLSTHTFSGPHPAGLPSTHIHFIDPVTPNKTVWQIHYQDVIAIGHLFTTGKLWVERVISLAGPLVTSPRLIRTRLGACTEDLIHNELEDVKARVISGSVLSGHTANNWAGYLGRFHQQISVIQEGEDREFLGWIMPGAQKFSILNVFLSKLLGKQEFKLSTSQNGSPRAMVPVGTFERVMPMDMLPTQLLRALVVKDTDMAQALGCLELEEDDLALCSFVCSGKFDYGPMLRANLRQIEKEG